MVTTGPYGGGGGSWIAIISSQTDSITFKNIGLGAPTSCFGFNGFILHDKQKFI